VVQSRSVCKILLKIRRETILTSFRGVIATTVRVCEMSYVRILQPTVNPRFDIIDAIARSSSSVLNESAARRYWTTVKNTGATPGR